MEQTSAPTLSMSPLQNGNHCGNPENAPYSALEGAHTAEILVFLRLFDFHSRLRSTPSWIFMLCFHVISIAQALEASKLSAEVREAFHQAEKEPV